MCRRFALALILSATAAFPQPDPQQIARIETLVGTEMSRQQIPAVSIAIGRSREGLWTSGYGMADLENFVPAKASTVYRLASISKPITATALLQQAERGKVDLDLPVEEYLDSFPRKPWPVTPRLLLSHLGGIRHYRGDDFRSTRHYTSVTAALEVFQNEDLVHEPGTAYLYTTYGYNILGAIVERAAGEPFIDYLRRHIFEPAAMDRIRDDDFAAIIPNRARGYAKTSGGALRNCDLADTSVKIPGGGLAGTAADLVKFALALNEGKLLKKETVAEMFVRRETRDGKPLAYGYGVVIGEWQKRRRISHGGGQQGTATLLHLYPDDGLALAIMCNLEGAALVPLADQLAQVLLN
jgi:CubicO group peptidase (beta-lactamase class C family)